MGGTIDLNFQVFSLWKKHHSSYLYIVFKLCLIKITTKCANKITVSVCLTKYPHSILLLEYYFTSIGFHQHLSNMMWAMWPERQKRINECQEACATWGIIQICMITSTDEWFTCACAWQPFDMKDAWGGDVIPCSLTVVNVAPPVLDVWPPGRETEGFSPVFHCRDKDESYETICAAFSTFRIITDCDSKYFQMLLVL